MPAKDAQPDSPTRSPRRRSVAERRVRRAAGLPAERRGARLGRGLRTMAAHRATLLGGLWAGALAVGLAAGLWIGRPLPETALPVAGSQPAEPAGVALADAAAGTAAPRAGQAPLAGTAGAARAGRQSDAVAPPAAASTAGDARAAAVRAAAPSVIGPRHEAPDGPVPAWRANAIPVALDRRPMVAVVLDDLGLNRTRTAAAAALPGPLTLSFLAYAENLPAQTRLARAAGHELLLHQPMEPEGAEDPGPQALLTGLSAAENRARLEAALNRLPGIVGINNHMGSRFTADAAAMRPVMAALRARGLLYLDSRTTGRSVGVAAAAEAGVPHAGRDVFLDHDRAAGRAYVERRLAELEALAHETGAAVAIGHPADATLAALADWLPGLSARGLQLVPISAIVGARQDRQLADAARSP
jgi:hypothetical protein